MPNNQDDLNRKLNYLNETKQEIKRSLKAKGQPVNDNTTFREYANLVSNITTGTDTQDADATPNDILSPKTAYVKGQKITGKIETEYKNILGNIQTQQITFSDTICDYRPDIGYYLNINATENIIEVRRILDNSIAQQLNRNNEISQDGSYNLTIGYAKFSRNPLNDGRYNIFIIMYKYKRLSSSSANSGYRNGIVIQRFDINKDTELQEHFSYFYDDGSTYNNYTNVAGYDICESDNGYVFTSLLTDSSYWMADKGATRLFYINNDNNTISLKASYSNNNMGTNDKYYNWICEITEDASLIYLYSSDWNVILKSEDNYSTLTQQLYFATKESTPRPIFTDMGYIYRNNYCTSEGVIHVYDSIPIKYDDITFYLTGGFIVSFNGTNIANVYKIDLTTYEITTIQGIEFDGIPQITYPHSDNRKYLSNSIFPMLSTNRQYLIVNTNNSKTYLIYPDLEGKQLDTISLDGVTLYNTLTANTLPKNVLSGNFFYGQNGMLIGTMPNNGTLNITPGIEDKTIPLGYTDGGTVNGDENLVPENIIEGKTIFGVQGNATGSQLRLIQRNIEYSQGSNIEINVYDSAHNKIDLLGNNSYLISTDPIYIQIEQNGYKYNEQEKSITVNSYIDAQISELTNTLTDDYENSNLNLTGTINNQSPSYSSSETLTFNTVKDYKGLYTNGSSYITYSLNTSISSYDVQFDFYKANTASYPRVCLIQGPNYEIEIKGSSNTIYWDGELNGGWIQNKWNTLKLHKEGNRVQLYINNKLIATRTYSAAITGIRFGRGNDSGNYFTGYYKNVVITDNSKILEQPIITITPIGDTIDIIPKDIEQQVAIPEGTIQANVSAIDFITTDYYQQCLDISEEILGI